MCAKSQQSKEAAPHLSHAHAHAPRATKNPTHHQTPKAPTNPIGVPYPLLPTRDPRPMPRRSFQTPLAEGTCRMICTISAAMVGVCLTGVGLLRVSNAVSRTDSWADDLLSVDAIFFLVATLSAYFALRTETEVRLHRLERIADVAFIAAMILLTAACFFITYAVSL